MKKFNLFLAFLVYSSVAMAAKEDASFKDVFLTKAYAWTVKPVVNGAKAVNGYVSQADTTIINLTKSATDKVVTFVKPATDKVSKIAKPATDKVSTLSQEAYVQVSEFVQRPAAMIIAAAAISATYYAYTQYNEEAKKSKITN